MHIPNSGTLTSTDFLVLDQPEYKVNTQTLSAGLEKQWNDYLFSGTYSVSTSKGDNSSGLVETLLPAVDARVDNLLQSVSLGMEYHWKKNMSLRGVFTYDNYKDYVYQDLSGGYNTFMVGLNYRL